MQRRQHRPPRRREIVEEIDSMHVDEVDVAALQNLRDGMARRLVGDMAGLFIDYGRYWGQCDQLTEHTRSVAPNYRRIVSSPHQSPIEQKQNLLGPACAIRSNRRKRISDTQDPERPREAMFGLDRARARWLDADSGCQFASTGSHFAWRNGGPGLIVGKPGSHS